MLSLSRNSARVDQRSCNEWRSGAAIEQAGSSTGSITCSSGYPNFDPREGGNPEEQIAAAEREASNRGEQLIAITIRDPDRSAA